MELAERTDCNTSSAQKTWFKLVFLPEVVRRGTVLNHCNRFMAALLLELLFHRPICPNLFTEDVQFCKVKQDCPWSWPINPNLDAKQTFFCSFNSKLWFTAISSGFPELFLVRDSLSLGVHAVTGSVRPWSQLGIVGIKIVIVPAVFRDDKAQQAVPLGFSKHDSQLHDICQNLEIKEFVWEQFNGNDLPSVYYLLEP